MIFRSRKIHSAGGFTLVELLVVVSVIATLMGILVPSLNKAREQAKRVVCSSNIRQLHTANTGFALEHGGHYVCAAENFRTENLHRWHGERDHLNEAFEPERGPLASYLADGEVARCPAFGGRDYHEGAGQDANFEAGCGGYGYNDQFIGSLTVLSRSARVEDIKRPAQTVMFADTAFYSNRVKGLIEYSFAHSPYWKGYKRSRRPGLPDLGMVIDNRPTPAIHFRHGIYTNVCWADGHVSRETMDMTAGYVEKAWFDEEGSAKGAVGCFGPDDNSLFDLK